MDSTCLNDRNVLLKNASFVIIAAFPLNKFITVISTCIIFWSTETQLLMLRRDQLSSLASSVYTQRVFPLSRPDGAHLTSQSVRFWLLSGKRKPISLQIVFIVDVQNQHDGSLSRSSSVQHLRNAWEPLPPLDTHHNYLPCSSLSCQVTDPCEVHKKPSCL